MGMQQTSLLAWHQIHEENLLPPRQALVLRTFKLHGDQTNLELSKRVFLPINQITPRTNELVKMGFIERKRTRPCNISGRIAIVWGEVR